jgi:hypothetical protein
MKSSEYFGWNATNPTSVKKNSLLGSNPIKKVQKGLKGFISDVIMKLKY